MLNRSNPNWGNEYVIDTKRGVVVNVRNMTELQDMIYMRNFFTSARPDLSGAEKYQWSLKLDMGEKLLMAMRHNLQREALRVNRLYPLASRYERLQPFYEQYIQLSQPFIKGLRQSAHRDWEDQSKLVNYVEQILFKVKKYGISQTKIVSPLESKKLEDEIAQRFQKEMRKPPHIKSKSQSQED